MTALRLRPALGVPGTVVLCLSGVAPAQSLFVLGPQLFREVGTGAFDSFAMAVILATPMALVYAELGSHHRDAGGEYAIIRRVLGARAGRSVLALLVFAQALIVALVALSVAAALVPAWAGLQRSLLAAMVLCGAGLCAARGLHGNVRFAGWLLLLEIALLAAICIVALSGAHRSAAAIVAAPVHLRLGQLVATSPLAMLAAVPTALLLLNGFGSAVYFSEEIREGSAARTGRRIGGSRVARAVLLTLAATVLAEGLPLLAVSWTGAQPASMLLDPNAFTAPLHGADLPGGPWLLSLLIAALLFRALVAIVLMTARLVYASGRDAFWPAPVNAILGRPHHKHGAPAAASIAVALCAIVVCLIDEKLLAELAGVALLPVQALLAVSALADRRRQPRVPGEFRMPLFPLPPVVALFVIVAVTLVGLCGTRSQQVGNAAAVSVLALFWMLPVGRSSQGAQEDQRSLVQDGS